MDVARSPRTRPSTIRAIPTTSPWLKEVRVPEGTELDCRLEHARQASHQRIQRGRYPAACCAHVPAAAMEGPSDLGHIDPRLAA